MLVQNDSLPKEPPCLQDMVLEQCRSHSKSQRGLSHAGEPQAVHRNFLGSEGRSHSFPKLTHIITINRSLKKTNKPKNRSALVRSQLFLPHNQH